MLFFLISCLSFLLLSKSLSFQPLISWANELRLLLVWFWQELVCLLVQWLKDCRLSGIGVFRMSPKKRSLPKVENVEMAEFSILDLPELTLECILGRLSPAGLCNMVGVCSSLRDRCRSDHLWERHMKEKWGRVIGQAAYREWQWFIALRKNSGVLDGVKSRGWLGSLSCMWPISWLRSKIDGGMKPVSSLPIDSTMSWYLSLESGKFWFPAQVYNREHGHVGFMLSCYDAELSYDCHSDTFHARYPPHGRRTMVIEEGVQWERLRAPPIDTPAHELHVSDCLSDLRPGDHIEIQWRRNKEFPYGWWYGVVGHLESCDGNEHLCCCHNSDTVMLEFNQYTPGSRWRRTAINRKDHREAGNEGDGFYGGIRKLHSKEEIAMWKRLWPAEVLE
ncbi:F-box-like protein isoform X1 [Cinnamomum micranthum f. kanehirae]|uniref:F-box-like protein isoform X1 n=1 Tax=Cinnamomum micranthum f. kanehirae TaxID=337451 RepID=A0A443NMP0_9MAGN|nr:F-box-like protein isoform X1 [Cinnamomum micranthum f. kanehirae]